MRNYSYFMSSLPHITLIWSVFINSTATCIIHDTNTLQKIQNQTHICTTFTIYINIRFHRSRRYIFLISFLYIESASGAQRFQFESFNLNVYKTFWIWIFIITMEKHDSRENNIINPQKNHKRWIQREKEWEREWVRDSCEYFVHESWE